MSDQVIVLLWSSREVFEGFTRTACGLRDIVAKEEWEPLRNWAELLYTEMRLDCVVMAWHPELDVDILAQHTKQRAVEIVADSAQDALNKYQSFTT